MLDTPVLFLIFNRPDLTEATFSQIRKARPRNIFIAADGPRIDNPSDKFNCEKTRNLVKSMIDWDCKLHTLYRKENLGCGLAVSQAINWFFENVDKGIILEDDCWANDSFFRYCEELLNRYENENEVMHISGLNWQKKIKLDSYYFSRYPGIWGWATWADSWSKFQLKIDDFPTFVEDDLISGITSIEEEKRYHLETFEEAHTLTKYHIWGYQWKYAIFKNKGLCITPGANLVSNLGGGSSATHTKSEDTLRLNRKIHNLKFPLKHPEELKVNEKADKYYVREQILKHRIPRFSFKRLKYRV